jgi:hypothetical protein
MLRNPSVLKDDASILSIFTSKPGAHVKVEQHLLRNL